MKDGRKEGCRKGKTAKLITYKQKTKCVSEWAELLNINYGTLSNRINRGWAIERAFTQEIQQH